jgi:CRP-like cAMP-binding protein
MPDEVIEELSYGMKPEYCEQGSYLFKEGDFTTKIWFVVSGHLGVSFRCEGAEAEIEDLYRGCSVGLYCGLMGEPQSINAQAKTPCHLYSIDIAYFRDLAPFIPEVHRAIEAVEESFSRVDFPLLDFRLYRYKRETCPNKMFKCCVIAACY